MSDRAYANVQAQQKTSIGSSPKNSLLQRTCACGQHTIAGAECDACRNEQSTLHRSQRAFGSPSAPVAVQGNAPAQENVPSFNSVFDRASRFGQDFSRIPVHSSHSPVLQTKLTINHPGDVFEQEADRVAEQVMITPAHHPLRGTLPRIQRFSGQSNGQVDAAPASVDQALASPGRPLEPALRQDMEPRFGYDFSLVRVHSGAAAEQSAREVNAHAYTVGHDIVFDAGRYAPGTHEGRRLIAHELAHTIQQSSVGSSMALQRAPAGGSDKPTMPLEPLEAVAQRIARLALGPKQAEGGFFRSKVLTVIRNKLSGQIFVGLNTGIPKELTDVIDKAIEAQKARISSGEVTVIHNVDPGTHSEVNALNRAIAAQQKLLGHSMTEEELGDIFELHNVWLSGEGRRFTSAPRCEHCARITRSVSVTQSMFFAEGGVAGEITVPQRGSVTPSGGTAKPVTRTSGEITTPSTFKGQGGTVGSTSQPEPAVTAEVRAPLEPVVEATPGFRPERGAGFGGAFQILQAMQFANLQQAEIDKFQKRFAELQPKIDAFLERGYSVELILIVEKPNSPDFFCAAGVYCDQSQFIYFHDLYINYVESVKPVISPAPRATTSYPTMSSPGGRDSFIPYTHQGGSIIDEKEIPYLRTRDPLHHCEYAKLTLHPQESISPIEASRPPVQPVKPKPRLDPATKKALASAPSRVYLLTGNIIQYKTAYEVIKKLTGNPSFVFVKEYMSGGFNGSRTRVSYVSDLDKPRAEVLAEIVRSEGVSSAYAELSGSGDDAPGVLQIFFGRDAEKPG